MRLRTPKAIFAATYIDIERAAGVAGARWEPFQLKLLHNRGRVGIDNKSRQIAWAFTAAMDAVIDGILYPGTPHLFVSINQEEATEKILYAKAILEAMQPERRPVLVRDSRTALEFANGSRLISHPCRPVRGKARARIYLDEMAHYPDGLDREIYRAALPATTKGDGYLRIGSSPFGARGLFWEIMTQSLRLYPGFDGHRRNIPWWQIRALCRNVPTATSEAPTMPTEERVERFGMAALIDIAQNMLVEDFQQEYECAWVDEATAWIDWETIKDNQARHDGLYWHAKGAGGMVRIIDELLASIQARPVRCDRPGELHQGHGARGGDHRHHHSHTQALLRPGRRSKWGDAHRHGGAAEQEGGPVHQVADPGVAAAGAVPADAL